MTNVKTVNDVKTFWETNPLFTGESKFPAGSREYFDDHRNIYISDCFAGELDPRLFPRSKNQENVLDLGCGPGFWVVELSKRGAVKITAADLTDQALQLTGKRAELHDIEVTLSVENAEKTNFPAGTFSHVNCQGVIHHTPDTQACVGEISRILLTNGSALISVYHKNLFIRAWPLLKYLGKALSFLGGGLKGRGRESIFSSNDVNEIVRLYDGDENPIGKAYSKSEFKAMLEPYLEVEEVFYHFFPARALPFPIPGWLHRFLDKNAGFMIYALCRKTGDKLSGQ